MTQSVFTGSSGSITALNANFTELYSVKSEIAADRTYLKAIDTTKTVLAVLVEAGREGVFKWTAGDFAARVTADSQEGIFVKANAIASSSGAWVRVVADGAWYTDWFAVPTDGSTNCVTSFNALMATANISKPATIHFGNAIYVFQAKPTGPTYQVRIKGHNNGSQQTIIRKDYTEASSTLGLFALTTHGGTFEDLYFNATGSASGGSAISAILPGNATNVGQLLIRRCSISGVNGFTQDLYIDGSAATSGALGYRQVFFESFTSFGGTSGTARNGVVLKSCQHVFGSNCFFQDKTVLLGISAVPCDDVHLDGLLGTQASIALDLGAGSATTDYITRCTFGGYIFGAVVNNSVNTTTTWILGRVSSTVNRSWDITTCGVVGLQGGLQQYTLTIANNGTTTFGTQTAIFGMLLITDSEGYSAIFNLKGSLSAAALSAGDATYWSVASGTASKTNVYWNAGGYYAIENKRGASRNYSVTVVGSYASF